MSEIISQDDKDLDFFHKTHYIVILAMGMGYQLMKDDVLHVCVKRFAFV